VVRHAHQHARSPVSLPDAVSDRCRWRGGEDASGYVHVEQPVADQAHHGGLMPDAIPDEQAYPAPALAPAAHDESLRSSSQQPRPGRGIPLDELITKAARVINQVAPLGTGGTRARTGVARSGLAAGRLTGPGRERPAGCSACPSRHVSSDPVADGHQGRRYSNRYAIV